MAFVRSSYVLMILAAGFAAFCLGGMWPLISLMDASTIASVIAVAVTSAVAMLATAVGALMVSDWQADVRTRQDWAQLGITPVHISRRLESACARDLESRYLPPTSDEVLRQALQLHRVAARTTCSAPSPDWSAGLPSAQPVPDQASDAGASSKTDAPERAASNALRTRATIAKTVWWKGRSRAKVMAARVRLAVNGDTWPGWPTPTPPRGDNAADVIVLSDRQREQAPPLTDASVVSNGAESTAQPTCRGPPRPRARRSAVPPDPIVCDNFGPRLPIGRAELDVLETYLERELRELLGYAKQAGDSEKA